MDRPQFLYMKKETVVILIAVGSGLLATILVFNFLKAAHQVQGRFVLAQTNISKGQMIEEKDIELSSVMKKSDTKNLFLELSDVIGQIAVKNIKSGSLVLRSSVSRQVPGVARKPLPIPQGMRALTISRANMTNVPDFLDIGSYVDVIGVSTDNPMEQEEMHTIVVSRQVISVSPLEGQPLESITVGVLPKEAEAVLEAASIRPLQILVRQRKADQRAFEGSTGTVEIIRGTQKEGVFRK